MPPVYAGDGKAGWLWLFAFFIVITVGELYLSPAGLSFVTKVAPAHMLSLMMGVWLATSFIGSFLSGFIGSYWSRMPHTEFFLMVASIAADCRRSSFSPAVGSCTGWWLNKLSGG